MSVLAWKCGCNLECLTYKPINLAKHALILANKWKIFWLHSLIRMFEFSSINSTVLHLFWATVTIKKEPPSPQKGDRKEIKKPWKNQCFGTIHLNHIKIEKYECLKCTLKLEIRPNPYYYILWNFLHEFILKSISNLISFM